MLDFIKFNNLKSLTVAQLGNTGVVNKRIYRMRCYRISCIKDCLDGIVVQCAREIDRNAGDGRVCWYGI